MSNPRRAIKAPKVAGGVRRLAGAWPPDQLKIVAPSFRIDPD
jgi:hypothetical protein